MNQVGTPSCGIHLVGRLCSRASAPSCGLRLRAELGLANSTSAGTAREALERLRQRNAKILGVVYNCAKSTANYYRRYGRGDDTEATRPLGGAARA